MIRRVGREMDGLGVGIGQEFSNWQWRWDGSAFLVRDSPLHNMMVSRIILFLWAAKLYLKASTAIMRQIK